MSKFTFQIGPDTRITFPAKPDESIRALLKGAGFRWSPAGGCWWRRGVKGAADFIEHLDRKLNPGRPDGACWRCKSPDGFFRNEGAATPVYCDACYSAYKATQPDSSPFVRRAEQYDRFDMDYEDRCAAVCGR
ncbi:MAG: hypothetical protein ACJ8C4_08540 [Gemmataceae bacterium]